MQKQRIAIKNHQQEIQLIARRSMLIFIFMLILVGLLISRLAYLQIAKQEVYSTLATQNWMDLVPVEPTRGLIYDRNGILLAENIPVFSLDVIPMKVPDLNKTISELNKIIDISDNDLSQFKKQLRQHRYFDEIPLKLRLTDEEVARFTENQHRFPGVLVQARLMRHYPYGTTFSHVLGYVGRINSQELKEIDPVNYSASHYIGKLGIEKYYEEDLHGRVGYEQVETDASGQPIRVLKEIAGVPGKNIYLTIDSGLQFVAEKALDGHRGAIVAIQPASGQVLAMVSEPGYDPNIFVAGISQNDYQTLQQSPDKPLFNRALRGLYPLASTIKPYLALGALDLGVTTEKNEISDPGWFQLPGTTHKYHDWHVHGHISMVRAITVSCDIYFYDLATKLGINRLDNILHQFGFGSVTGIDLDDELPGIVASPEWKEKNRGVRWYGGDTVISGIGQGFMQATPLQLASAVATMANRGQRFMPYLLLGEQEPNNTYTQQQPIPVEPVVLNDNKNWDTIIGAMQKVVSDPEGTAYARFTRNHKYTYTIAGKTGTAQVVAKRGPYGEEDNQDNLPEKFRDHHLFIAFAPVDHPKIAVAIITENSNVALEAAQSIFDYYLGQSPNVIQPASAEAKKTSR